MGALCARRSVARSADSGFILVEDTFDCGSSQSFGGLPLPVQQTVRRFVSSPRALARWKRAATHIRLLLRLRRKFYLVGEHLKKQRIQSLFEGIQRVKGRVQRVKAASS
jgi:hypothetical protein